MPPSHRLTFCLINTCHTRYFAMGKRIRFGDLVRASGRPEVLTLWRKPKEDRAFMNAVKANRVLTVFRGRHNKKDVGQIGFHKHDGALYLEFPRPLKGNPKEQVIGINYELFEQPPVVPPGPSNPKPRRREATTKPLNKEFKVTVRRV